MQDKTRQIVKNTGMLYLRMLFLMCVQLYTSRVVLDVLGVSDFGIYNLVGGIVVLLQFLNNSLALSVNRYIAFSLGKGDSHETNKVFSMSLNIHILLSIIIFLVAETVGLWFVNTQLIIPVERIFAANVVYQFSVLTCFFSIIRVPYNALIISHEDMNVFAYIGMLEGLARLLIVYLLILTLIDRLEFYSALTFGITLLVFVFNFLYAHKKYPKIRFNIFWSKSLFLEMGKYAGLSTFGNLATACVNQGQSILLNIFFGPIINGVRAISLQVNSAVCGFVSNVYTAVSPPITKSYAANELDYMKKLVFNATKFSFFILLLIVTPLFFEIDFVLNLWLVKVPEYTGVFCRLILINSLIYYFATPSVIAIQATGNIIRIHLWTGFINLLNLLFGYIALHFTKNPASVFAIQIIISVCMLIATLFIQRKELKFKLIEYLKKVLLPAIIIMFFSSALVCTIYLYISDGFFRFFAVCISSTLTISFLVYQFSMDHQQRIMIKKKISSIWK